MFWGFFIFMVNDYFMDGDLCEVEVLVVFLDIRNCMYSVNLFLWVKLDIFLFYIGYFYFYMFFMNRGESICND